ncbi:hypothetical protein NEF87_003399 [Candidatus Lokiarchaeum ossiferum]|uniref:Uncharacterized protein n=1 Tax=Candidatus Lokiarchaeum ossiferum TaxID=2951803 RepID=A0ABY6HXD8_9ARCH|nr:hypothetical protein NEF87_003399 [Candidatus Lokiarchaeum sp. B-35]
MVKYLTISGSILATIGIILRNIFGTLFLYLGKIPSDGYYRYKSLIYQVTPVSIGQVLIYFGIFLILISEVKGTNKLVAWGSTFISFSFIMGIYDEFTRFTGENPTSLGTEIIIASSLGFLFLGLSISILGLIKLQKNYLVYSWIRICIILWIVFWMVFTQIVYFQIYGVLSSIYNDIIDLLFHLPFLIQGWIYTFVKPIPNLNLDQLAHA